MIIQRKDTLNDVGTSLFMVLFFLLICAFSHYSDTSVGRSYHYKSMPDLHAQVTALNDAHPVQGPTNQIRLIEKTNFNLLSDGCKLVSENRSVHHNIKFLQKAELRIKPVVRHRCHYPHHANDTDDLPALS